MQLRQMAYKILFHIRYFLYGCFPNITSRIYFPRHNNFESAPPIFLTRLAEDTDPFPGTAIPDGLEELMTGRFQFLNHSHCFAGGVDWHSRDVSHLWRYQLHYFDYALDLGTAYRIGGDRDYYLKFKELVASWCDQNPVGRLDGWHAYTVSIRSVNWIYARELFLPELKKDPVFDRKLLELLYGQFNFLSSHLEFQGRGNHILANIKALLFGGCMFQGPAPRHWLARAERLLEEEIDEQVLPDGGHFERSSMYHLQVLKDLVECVLVLKRCGNSPATKHVEAVIRSMSKFVLGMIAPDDSMPLCNDSSYDLMLSPLETLQAAREIVSGDGSAQSRAMLYFLLGLQSDAPGPAENTVSTSLGETGYYVMRGSTEDMMVIDCGKVCPDYLPPHAHADTLTFDLWAGGVHFITDSGTYEYAAGEWRDYFRSTRAHNTICVDEMDQSEVWASFRVARRANPGAVTWIGSDEGDYFYGSHDGYLRLKDPVQHVRRVLHIRNHFWLVLDTIIGEEEHHVESNVHFHPEVSLSTVESGVVEATRNGQTLTLATLSRMETTISSGSEDPKQGWYSPEFGIRLPRKTISMRYAGKLPHTSGYVLTSGKAVAVEVEYRFGDLESYDLSIEGRNWSIEVDRASRRFFINPDSLPKV
jgi:uncharacterized heparinase superfamily protein